MSQNSCFVFIMTCLTSKHRKGRKLKMHLLYTCIIKGCIPEGWNGKGQRLYLSRIYYNITCVSEDSLWGSSFMHFFLWQHMDLLRSCLCQALFQVLESKTNRVHNLWNLLYREVDAVVMGAILPLFYPHLHSERTHPLCLPPVALFFSFSSLIEKSQPLLW